MADRPPGTGSRAPWERRISRTADTGNRVSVAELQDRIAASEPIDVIDDAPTEQIPAITPFTAKPEPFVEPHLFGGSGSALPEHVGSPPPVLTRLAMSKNRKRKRVRLVARSLVSLIAIMSLALTGVVWEYLRTTDQGFTQVAALDQNSTDVVDAAGQNGDETYLIVGTDTRAGASGQVGAGTVEDAEGARSDTVMLVNIPADRTRVVAVSFPRDLDVYRPECQGWDNATSTYTSETYPAADGDKLNATYALGGPKCLVKVIQKISGLKIGHFVGMDFAGFESMVDEVGGVQVCSTAPLIDDELGTVLASAGTQTVDGKTALNYVRARKVEAEGNGDYGRIKRQQRFLSSLLRSALSNKVLLDPAKLSGFVNAFTRDTFVENVGTQDLITLGRSLQGVDAGAVTFLTIPTDGTNSYGNEIPVPDQISAIFQAIINDDPLPGEKRAAAPDAAVTPVAPTSELAVDPSSVSIQVSNASQTAGIAQTVADELATYGFQILTVGNFAGTSATNVVRYAAGSEAAAATVASSIPGAGLEEAPNLGTVIEVVLGSSVAPVSTPPTEVGLPNPAVPVATTSLQSAPLPDGLTVTNGADATCA